jgi:SagB-type dehydrogenase family enzyme
MFRGIGDEFQNNTKHSRQKFIGGRLDWAKKPATYKKYPLSKMIPLHSKFPVQSLPFFDVIKRRRSVRSFSTKPLSMQELSFVLWASTGIQRREHGNDFRTAPSAGALYPIETYLVSNNVEGLEQALYHYNIEAHALEEVKVGNFTGTIAHGALEQEMAANAPLVLIWTAVFERSKWKYGQRGYRYVYLDAGHVAQNLALAATSIGLGSCHIGAFFDDEVNQILGVDGVAESVVYLSVVGHQNR